MMFFSSSRKCTLESATSGNVSCAWVVQTFPRPCALAGPKQKNNIFILHFIESDIKRCQNEKGLKLQNFTPDYKAKQRKKKG